MKINFFFFDETYIADQKTINIMSYIRGRALR